MTDAEDDVKFEPKSLAIKFVAALLVLLIGAAVFMELERGDENKSTDSSVATKAKHNFAAKYNMSLEDLAKLETLINQEATEKEEAESFNRWTYSSSVFFTFTIMTTIGYGHMSPQTWQGQLFCIFFSLIGIPVAGLMLISVGNHVSLAIRVFIRFLEKTGLCKVVSLSAEMKSTIITFLLMILMIVFGAILTSYTDDWAFIEGVYFTFISVSTIGFGDYVVNDGELRAGSDHSKTVAVNFTIVLITLGLCVVSSVLCSVSAVIEERQKRMNMRMPGAASNAINAANIALNSVTSSLPIKLSTKNKVAKDEGGSTDTTEM